MSLLGARQLFRSCTASLSSRSIRRASGAHPSRRLAGRTRQYSDDKASTSTQAKYAPDEVKEEAEAEAKADAKEGEQPESEYLAKLQAKDAEVLDLTSRLRYLQADFLNLQRNAAREKEQQRDFAITRFAGDLLETVDVLALALRSVPQSALSRPDAEQSSNSIPPSSSVSDFSSPPSPPQKSPSEYLNELHHGVEMTHRLLLSTLFKYHVKPFDPTGDKFDPNRHEALYQVPLPDKEPGTVLECQKIGYTIKERLLRAAQVGVVQEQS